MRTVGEMYGLKHTEVTKEKIRQSRFRRKKILGYINSLETRKKNKLSSFRGSQPKNKRRK